MSQPTLQIERIELADEHLEWEVELDLDPALVRGREEVEASHARGMAAVVW